MTDAAELFEAVVAALMRRDTPPCVADPTSLLGRTADPRRFPAAFLIALCGESHPRSDEARGVLEESNVLARYFLEAKDRIRAEIATAADDPNFLGSLQAAAGIGTVAESEDAFDRVWAVTFPEGVGLSAGWAAAVAEVGRRRRVEIETPHPDPISDPLSEILFTSNVVVTPGQGLADQQHWYDHPIPLDAPPIETELAHGLRALDEAVAYERSRHPEWRGPATVALSVSSTHDDPHRRAITFVRDSVAEIGPLPNLRIYCFDETLSRRLWKEVIGCGPHDRVIPELGGSTPVFGVSGSYGRHYSFLKALAALWNVCIDNRIRGTFKIDLDQSFPQPELVAETGQSAFEHLTTARWGARAQAATGQEVELVMIAGGLVNTADMRMSVFTPDVVMTAPRAGEDAIFFSPLVQAVSTAGEIVTRGDPAAGAGSAVAQERVHVTGGTTGILVDGLRRWRPFTPSVFGRAEDQAFLVSVLGSKQSRPGYLHEPGLIMRHDKGELIPDTIELVADAKHIGDLVRTMLFSAYASPFKTLLDPFTGCFVSRLPATVTVLRLALHALAITDPQAAGGYLEQGRRRLEHATVVAASLPAIVDGERAQWDFFYDSLDALERGHEAGEDWAHQARTAAAAIIDLAAVDGTTG